MAGVMNPLGDLTGGLLRGYAIANMVRRTALDRERLEQEKARQQHQEELGDQQFVEGMVGSGALRVTPEGLVQTGEGQLGPREEGQPETAAYDRFRMAKKGQVVRRRLQSGETAAYELRSPEEQAKFQRKQKRKGIAAEGKAESQAEITHAGKLMELFGRDVPPELGGGRAMPQHLTGIAGAARIGAELRGEDEQLSIPLPQKVIKALDLPPGSTAPSWDTYEHLVDAADKVHGMGAPSGEDKVGARAQETRKASRFSKFEAQADKLAKEENDLAAENNGAAAELEQITAQLERARVGGEAEDLVFYRQLEAKRTKLEATVKRNQKRIGQLIKERERVQANKDKIYGASKTGGAKAGAGSLFAEYGIEE